MTSRLRARNWPRSCEMTEIPSHLINRIVTGDMYDLAMQIPDESIDLVFTDPPYHPALHGLYGRLAEVAARVLKPGGFCFAYAGVAYLDAVMRQFARLDYFWTICGYQPESNLVFNSKNVGCHWRPTLVYSKGATRAPKFMGDTWRTNRDKRHHTWGQGQSLPMRYISLFTDVNDLILEPFVGGGTIPAVCKMLCRNYIGFEIDPDTAERARERVAHTQPPLFVPEPMQTGFTWSA